MTLKKILKYIDYGIDLRIWDITDEAKILYEGMACSVPKNIQKNYRLAKVKENGGGEAIFPFDNGKLRITVIRKV